MLVLGCLYFLRTPMKLAIGTSMVAFVRMALVGALYGAKLVVRFNTSLLKALFGFLFPYVSLKHIFLYVGIAI